MFDDVICIIIYKVFLNIAFSSEDMEHKKTHMHILVNELYQNGIGIGFGIFFGFLSIIFKYIRNTEVQKYLKFFYIIACALIFVSVSHKIRCYDMKYMACLVFGYSI